MRYQTKDLLSEGLDRVSITVMKLYDNYKLERKGFISAYSFQVLITEESPNRKSSGPEAGHRS